MCFERAFERAFNFMLSIGDEPIERERSIVVLGFIRTPLDPKDRLNERLTAD